MAFLLLGSNCSAAERKIPANCKPAHTGTYQEGLEFFVEIKSVDLGDRSTPAGTRSAISIVIQEMGGPGSWHKILIADRDSAAETAEMFFRDIAIARSNMRRSAGPCAAELL